MKCYYCTQDGILRVKKEEAEKLTSDIYVCDNCWRLLQNPATALPLIRGHLSLTEGRKMPEKQFKKMMDNYMDKLSKFKPTN